MVLAAVLMPVQLVVGDLHGLNTLEHQPQKIAAMEGNWETEPAHATAAVRPAGRRGAREPFRDSASRPASSLILKHDIDGVVPGLNDYVAEDGTPLHPRVAPVFWSFRVMVGTGMLMLLVRRRFMCAWRVWKHGICLASDGLLAPALFALVAMTFSGWLATLAGWYTTEIGRQPWLVQRRDDARPRPWAHVPARHGGRNDACRLPGGVRGADRRLHRRSHLARATYGRRLMPRSGLVKRQVQHDADARWQGAPTVDVLSLRRWT